MGGPKLRGLEPLTSSLSPAPGALLRPVLECISAVKRFPEVRLVLDSPESIALATSRFKPQPLHPQLGRAAKADRRRECARQSRMPVDSLY